MSKYEPLWKWVKDNNADSVKLSFVEIENICGFPIDHSFLTYKKELAAFGYTIGKISMKEQTAQFARIGKG